MSEFSKKMMNNFHIDELFSKVSEDKFRAMVYYFGLPVFFFIILAPGLLISIPPVKDCDTGVSKPFAPGRITVGNTVVHSIIFGLVIVGLFWYGSKHRIAFPFCAAALKS